MPLSIGLRLSIDRPGGGVAFTPIAPLGQTDFGDPTDQASFSRAQEAGFTGSGDADAFQREKDIDELRDGHYQGGVGPLVILEDDPTEIALAAPANVVAVGGEVQFSATWDNLPVMANVDHWRWRLNNTGSWTTSASNSLTNIAHAAGTGFVLNVEAVSDISGTFGVQGDSNSFDIEAPPIDPTLEAWYELEEGSGTAAGDSTTNNNDGTFVSSGGSLTWISGHIGGAITRNSYYLTLPANAFDLSGATSEFTLAAWVKLTATDTTVFGFRDSGSANQIIHFVIGFNGVAGSGTGKPSCLVRDNAGAGLTSVVGATAVNDDNWHHIALTRNSSKLLTIYVDGLSDASASDTMGTGCSFDSPWLGATYYGSVGGDGNCSWDDVRIYSSCLDSTEIAALAAM